jgi:hypothetical protein
MHVLCQVPYFGNTCQAFRGFLRDAAPLRPRETLFHVDMLLGVELSICHVWTNASGEAPSQSCSLYLFFHETLRMQRQGPVPGQAD